MDTWCNCQAIPGTPSYPGPWHEYRGEPHYPCAASHSAALRTDWHFPVGQGPPITR